MDSENDLTTLTHFSAFGKENGNASNNSPAIHLNVEDENIPKRIRSILELHMKDIIVEVLFSPLENEYSVAMRGLLHCNECLESWNNGKRNIGFHCEESTLANGNLMKFEKQEALHIIKLMIDVCHTEDIAAVLQILNEMNGDEGEFCIERLEESRSSERFNDFSPLLFVSPCGKRMSGTFLFAPEIDNDRSYVLFSPKFNVSSRLKGSAFKNLTVSIFADDDDFFCSRTKKKHLFSIASGELVDLKRVFTSGLLALCSKRYFFFSGRMKRDVFLPSACVSDTGILYQWPKESRQKQRVKFRHVQEIFGKTKFAFPVFPCGKISNDKVEWKFVNDRRILEVPTKLLQADSIDFKEGVATLYLGGELDADGALRPKSKLRIPSSKSGKLRIWPKIGEFQKIVFESYPDDPFSSATSVTSSSEESLPDESVLQPSGTPVNDILRDLGIESPSASSLRNLDGDKRSLDSLGRTPSIVSFREVDPKESRELIQQKSKNLLPRNQGEVLNPAVKNRTGRPNTKVGQLSDGTTATLGESDTTQLSNRPASMTTRRDSTARSATKFMQGSDAYGGSRPTNWVSQTGVGSRVSNKNLDPSRRRSTVLGNGNKAATPSTFARQRKIEKKTKKEKEEVKAKYQNAAHHSVTSGGAQDQLALGGTETSAAAFGGTDDPLNRTTPSQMNADKVAVMKAYTGDLKVPKPRRKARKRRTERSTTQEETDSTENLLVAEEKEVDPLLEDIPSDFIDDYCQSGEEDGECNFSDLTGSDTEEKETKHKSSYLPFLDGFTALNFTKNFRFSYFIMPGYVKEKNKNIKKGVLKLPVVKEDKKRKQQLKERGKGERRQSSLMKRIEKLNKFEGNADPRARQ